MSNRPTVVQCPDNQDQLAHCVDYHTDGWVDQIRDPQTDGIVVFQGNVLERADRHQEADCTDDCCGYPDKLYHNKENNQPDAREDKGDDVYAPKDSWEFRPLPIGIRRIR
jgi:hypothetical protein